jgi:Fe-S-cluster formation regulator IscX/YfhJ
VQKRITNKLSKLDFSPYKPKLVSVTCMSKWLVALFDFPKISAERSIEDIAIIDSVAGIIVTELLDYAVNTATMRFTKKANH